MERDNTHHSDCEMDSVISDMRSIFSNRGTGAAVTVYVIEL